MPILRFPGLRAFAIVFESEKQGWRIGYGGAGARDV